MIDKAKIIITNGIITIKPYMEYPSSFSLLTEEGRSKAYRYLINGRIEFPDEFPTRKEINLLLYGKA